MIVVSVLPVQKALVDLIRINEISFNIDECVMLTNLCRVLQIFYKNLEENKQKFIVIRFINQNI